MNDVVKDAVQAEEAAMDKAADAKKAMLAYDRGLGAEDFLLCGQKVELHALQDTKILEEQGRHDRKTWKANPIPLPDGSIFEARWIPYWCALMLVEAVRFPDDPEVRLTLLEAFVIYKNDPIRALGAMNRVMQLSGWDEEEIEATKKDGEPETADGGPPSSGSAGSDSVVTPESSPDAASPPGTSTT